MTFQDPFLESLGTKATTPVQSTPKKTDRPENKDNGIFTRLVSSYGESLKKTGTSLRDTWARQLKGEQGAGSTLIQTAGGVIGGATDLAIDTVGEVATSLNKGMGIDKSPSEVLIPAVNDFITSLNKGMGIDKSPAEVLGPLVTSLSELAEKHPVAAANINGIIEILGVVPLGKGVQVAGKVGLESAGGLASAGTKVGKAIGETVELGVKKIGETGIAQNVKSAGNVIGENARAVGTSLKQAPERVATNAAAMKAARQEVEQLPEMAQKAVNNGVDIQDARLLTEPVTQSERAVQKEMLDTAEGFGKTRSAKDPALVGGEVVTKRLDDLKKIVDDEGQKLGEIAATIPDGKVKGIFDAAITRLRAVPELKEITVSPTGKLNFAGTKLTTKFTKSDRTAIQDAWNSLYKRGGQDLHKLRQELFEVIKKQAKGAEGFTKTKDDAIQAIRMGISDGLDAVSSGYKAANKAYAKVVNPYEKLDKFFTKLKDQGEDVMSERGAALLRQLTSRNVKAPEIRGILKQVDDALAEFGQKSDVNLEKVQNFYDALQKNYDITPAQSFGGQLRTSDIPMSTKGIIEKTIGSVLEKGSITPEVRRKAFRDLFESITDYSPKGSGAATPKTALSAGSERVSKAFERSKNQVDLINDFQIGDFGKNAFSRKLNQVDRFSSAELNETIKNITKKFRASNDKTSYRYSNVAWISEMPGDEIRIIYSRKNRFGKKEIINAHKINQTKNPNYIKTLESFGIPDGN